MSTPVPIIRAEGEGDRQLFLGGGLHTWKLMAEDTDGAFFLFEDSLVKGKTTPLHCHPEADELVYGSRARSRSTSTGGNAGSAPAGMTYTPKGVPHAFLVVSDRARLLALQTPATGQEFYRGASEPATSDTSDAVDIARVQASAREHPQGVGLLGPPPFSPLETV